MARAPHHYRTAFVSYASRDRTEVLKRVQMLAGLRIAYFQDLLDLEPGERWQRELYRRIDESDLFLLFSSAAAKSSEWVSREVRYALQRQTLTRGAGGAGDGLPEIYPVILEEPPSPEPPPELSHLHFNDYLLYVMAGPPAKVESEQPGGCG